jgi:3',5'-cyclic AMP phosphodiesterase CpdA
VNTARALTWKDGKINKSQLDKLRTDFEAVPDGRTKIVVTHHPFDLPAGAHGKVVGRSRIAIKTLAELRVDVLLSGHFHIADVGYTAKRYNIPGYSALIVSSGTSTSTRHRGGQSNSLNLIRIEHPRVEIQRHFWKPDSHLFDALDPERFQRTDDGWIRE